MKIALVHNALLPPPKYGGTERIIVWLAKALVELGHKVVVLAASGSRLDFCDVITLSDFSNWEAQVPHDTDILHLWGTPTKVPSKPFLVTIEGNGKMGENFHPNTLFVSRKHAENHGSTHFVYNGIDPADFVYSEKKENFAVFLAKASWNVKNLIGAIEVARAANLRLEVLGSRSWPLQLHRLLPAWRGVKYHGMVGDDFKREILPRARALIFPVRWHEPFGIALTEALASGCFVAGTPYGSLPEIVSSEVGCLSTDPQVLANALQSPQKFLPKNCRERVLNHGFTHIAMAKNYLSYYERILTHGHIGSSATDQPPAPICQGDLQGRTLLPWGP